MARIVIYRRLSKDREGREVGVDRQEKLIREKLVKPDDVVVGVFTDNDISASSHSRKRRPDYERMIEVGEAGGCDVIASYSFKRLTRKYDEGGALLELAERAGIGYRFVRGAPVDLSSAAGRKAFRDMINDAIAETEEMSERVRDAFADKRLNGDHHGGKKTGFLNVDRGFVPDPDRAPRILADTRRVLAGVSLSTLVREWTAAGYLTPHGGTHWRIGSVKSVLLSPTNAGLLVHDGVELGKGNWDPIVPEAQWRALVALLGDPKRRTSIGPAGRKWLGGNMFLCGRCDDGETRVKIGTVKNKKVTGYPNPGYKCSTHTHLTIYAQPVDEFVLDAVAEVLAARGVGLLDTDHADELAALNVALDALRARRKTNARLFAVGDVEEVEYAEASAEITRQLNDAQARILQLTPSANPLAELADEPDPGQAFLDFPLERQRAVINAMCTVTIRPGKRGRLPGGGKGIDYGRIKIDMK